MNNNNSRSASSDVASKRPRSESRPTAKRDNSRYNSNKSRRRNNSNRRKSYSNSNSHNNSQGKAHLNVCTLSGTKEIGRNCNFIEYGNDILVIDFGLSFPGQELLGVDYTIPNFHYLVKNKHKIRGILITHGHLDHTGGLPYVVEKLGFPPIYAGRYANGLIKERFKEFDLDKKVNLIDVYRNKEVELGQFKAKFIGVTHSIPNSFSIFIESPKGNVFFSGDYKMDPTPANEHPTDAATLRTLRGKIDLALMESTNAEAEGHVLSDKAVAENLEEIIKNHDGRVVVAAFASLVSRLYSLVQIAQKHHRKVFVSGRSLNTAIKISQEQRYMEFPEGILIHESKINNYPPDQVLFLCTGSQGEKFAALNRISRGEHKYFKIKEGDLVLMSSSEIPGNEYDIGMMTDRLIEKGADLIQGKVGDIHGSGHGLKEDMHQMYELIQPKSIMPIHGNLTKRYNNKQNFMEWGMSEDKVHLTTDGAVWSYYPAQKEWKRTTTIESKAILIDGLGVGDISDIVLKDREQLSQYGMVTIVLNLSTKAKHLIGRPKFMSRGFVYVNNSKELFNEMEKLVRDTHKEWLSSSMRSKRYEYAELIKHVEKNLSKFIYKKTEREPMILPVII